LPAGNARRQVITEMYRKGLNQAGDGIDVPFLDSPGQSSYHIFPILLPEEINRQNFMQEMRKSGIQTSIHYPPVHHFSYYRQRFPGISLPKTESVAGREVTLPLFPGMRDEDVHYVLTAIHSIFSMMKNKG